jgi:hypothetical protein
MPMVAVLAVHSIFVAGPVMTIVTRNAVRNLP